MTRGAGGASNGPLGHVRHAVKRGKAIPGAKLRPAGKINPRYRQNANELPTRKSG